MRDYEFLPRSSSGYCKEMLKKLRFFKRHKTFIINGTLKVPLGQSRVIRLLISNTFIYYKKPFFLNEELISRD